MAAGGVLPEGYISDAKQNVVGKLVAHIEQNFKGFNVNEIIRAGSLGAGTAVPVNFDVDLVIYSQDISPDLLKLDAEFTPWLKQIDEFIKGTLHLDTEMTDRSVQFTYNEVDVDLLVSPYWKEPAEFYSFLKKIRGKKSREKRSRYSVCASKWQVEFFKSQPNKVKEHCKRAKAWRNKMWPPDQDGQGRPSSYLMSLLVVAAHHRKRRKQTVTQSLINLVENAEGRRLNVCWQIHYKRCNHSQLLPSRPRIVDPANPANNVWVSGIKPYRGGERLSNYKQGDGNCTLLKRYIRSIDLSKPVEHWL